jgi:hypothetical protein
MKLSDSQLILLANAAKRNDRIVVIPDSHKADSAKIVGPLLKAKLVEEIYASGKLPAWRRDDAGAAWALRITEAGLKSINADDSGVTGVSVAAAQPDVVETRAGKASAAAAKAAPAARRATASSKTAPASRKEARAKKNEVPAARSPGMPSSASTPRSSNQPREGSKLATVIDMLRRSNGASTQELISATGGLPHTTRAALTGLRGRGLTIERTTGKRGKETAATIYRIVGA